MPRGRRWGSGRLPACRGGNRGLRRGRVGLIALLVCTSGAAIASPGPGPKPAPKLEVDDAGTRFDAALELIGRDDRGAAERLVALAAQPEGAEFAPDALVQAAELFEERLGRPDQARKLYATVVARYPDSRLSMRARARLAWLEQNLGSGAAVLGEYQRILSGFAGRPAEESRRMMEHLVRDHPDFSLADRALLWLATEDARSGRFAEAQARFAEVERRFPGRESAALARSGRADALLAAGHPLTARSVYRSLLDRGGPAESFPSVAAAAGRGLAASTTAIRRLVLFVVALAVVAMYLGAALALARPLLPLRSPVELTYYLPIAALLVLLAALSQARPVAIATSFIAAGGAAVTFASSKAAARRLERGRPPPLGWGPWVLATSLAVLALAYAAIHATGLIEFVIETIRSGPET